MASKQDPLTSVHGKPKIPGGTSVSCLFTWLGTKGDYASIARQEAALKGWKRYFSSVTKEGRLNMVVGTYIAVAVTAAVMWNKYKQKRAAHP